MSLNSTSPWRNRVSSARLSSPGRGTRRSRLRPLRRPTRGLLGIDHLIEQLENRSLLSSLTVGPNVNISKSLGNQAESTISINPTNPLNLFESDTVSTQGHFSTDGGATWNASDMSALPASLGDVQTTWDSFGNLFLTQFGPSGPGGPFDLSIVVGLSTDGGASFTLLGNPVPGFGYDQPSIAVGPGSTRGSGSVWVSVTNGSNQIVAAGASVTGLGVVGAFNPTEVAPGPGGDFGSIAVGPNGQVMVDYQDNFSGIGPDTIKVNLDPDGLGPAGFNSVVIATSTNVGGFAPIPAQPSRTIDAEANLAWDRSGGPHNGRVYMVYTDRPSTLSADTDIDVRFSDDNGTTWSSPTRVNDDPVGDGKSQFLPAIAVDQVTGDVAVTWYDTRNSGAANDTTQVFGSASLDGGAIWLANEQISTGTSKASAVSSFNYGDYDLMDFHNGVFYRTWADNSNSTGDNPNGTSRLDIYTAKVIISDDLGLLLLDPTGANSLMVTGNGNVTVSGTSGAVVVDSNAPTNAAFVTGNGVVTAGDFDVTGGVFTAGHGTVPSPVDHEALTPDPLGLAPPSPLPPAPVGNTATVLHPGTYVGGLKFSGKSAVTLLPGVYVMEGGGFSVSGQGSIRGSGVVIINIPGGPSDSISVSGKGVVSLSAPTSGPFKGVAVFQASGNPVDFSGQANVTIAGVFYTPKAPVSITGNAVVTINPGPGTTTLPPISAAMIAFDLKVDGNGNLTINPDDSPASSAAQVGGGAAGVQAAAIDALVSGGGLTGRGGLTDQEAMNEVAMSLVGNADLFSGAIGGAKKKTN